MVYREIRLDYAGPASGQIVPTAQGGGVFHATLTRCGVFTYWRTNEVGVLVPVREYRDPAEVFATNSLATLEHAPVTQKHPEPRPLLVTAENYQKYARGHVIAGSLKTDGVYLEGDLAIQDLQLLTAIANDELTECSLGYNCDLVREPGVSSTGEPYDVRQVNIVNNHVAIVEKGRGGSDVRLHLDSADNLTEASYIVETIEIDGIVYPLGTPAERQAANAAFKRYVAKMEGERTRLDAANGELTGKLTTAEKALAVATDRKRLDAAVDEGVQAMVSAVMVAQKVIGADYDYTGKTADQVMADVVAAKFPDVDVTGKDPAFIAGLFAAAGASAGEEAAEGETVTEDAVATPQDQNPPATPPVGGAPAPAARTDARDRRTPAPAARRPGGVSLADLNRARTDAVNQGAPNGTEGAGALRAKMIAENAERGRKPLV